MTVPSEKYKWVMLGFAFAILFSNLIHFFAFVPLIPTIRSSLSLSFTETGILASTFSISFAVGTIPAGVLFDRYGVVRPLRTGMAIAAVGTLMRGFLSDYVPILLDHAAIGFGLGILLIGLPKIVVSWFPPRQLGMATNVYILGWPLGNIFVLSVTPLVSEITGSWRTVFHIYGIWATVLAGLWWAFGKEPARKPLSNSKLNALKGFVFIAKQRESLLLMGLYLCSLGISAGLITWLPSILNSRGLGLVTSGIIAAVIPAGFAVGSMVLGRLSDLISSRKVAVWVPALFVTPSILAVAATKDWLLIVSAFSLGFASLGAVSLVFTVVLELPKLAPYVGSTTAFMSSLGNVASFVLPVAMGVIQDRGGGIFEVLLPIALLGTVMPILGLMLPETHPRRSTPVSSTSR